MIDRKKQVLCGLRIIFFIFIQLKNFRDAKGQAVTLLKNKLKNNIDFKF